jgi:dethiobiotin synthetase
VCPQKFLEPLAPPESAAQEGSRVDHDALAKGLDCWIDDDFDVCIVEGAGGLMSPIADAMLNLDFARLIQPDRTIVVAANRLGTIHQTLATLAAAKVGELNIDGIVLNQALPDEHLSQQTNTQNISKYSEVPVLAELGYANMNCPKTLANWLTSCLP